MCTRSKISEVIQNQAMGAESTFTTAFSKGSPRKKPKVKKKVQVIKEKEINEPKKEKYLICLLVDRL